MVSIFSTAFHISFSEFSGTRCCNYIAYCFPFWCIITINSQRASRRTRPSRSLTNTFYSVTPPWLHSNSSPLLCFSPSGLWSPSRFSPLWCPPQCCKTVVLDLSPEYVPQPVPPSSSCLSAYVIEPCHHHYNLAYHSLLPSSPQYPP